jgi:hypothetical protein
MSTAELAFDGQTFQIARQSLVSACQAFVENRQLLEKPCEVRSRASEAHFWLFPTAIEETTTEIRMENVIDLELLSGEF